VSLRNAYGVEPDQDGGSNWYSTHLTLTHIEVRHGADPWALPPVPHRRHTTQGQANGTPNPGQHQGHLP
jgi:hypothetical protein